ncbi:MAG: radical SAM protein [Legionellales bacterium]|nr:radical SAM protein [Legionellales bacterium]|tara:strand:+ start:4488 stop:5333 length:846 start_codon:yes stop_codon:yes gene_type:complete
MLTTKDHSREKAGLTYIYPVLSRRAGGLSIGINLNINNACNWRCIYCQVPELIRGAAPVTDLDKLAHELRYFLADVMYGDFYDREEVADEYRVIKDIAISGNGEPTTASNFYQVVNLLELILEEYSLLNSIKCVLITNGSMVSRTHIKKGLKKLARIKGEVWFKIDSATPQGVSTINQIKGSRISTLKRLKISANHCPTWIQTCVFMYKNKPPCNLETDAYINLLKAAVSQNILVRGVLLYGVERKSMQPEAKEIKKLPSSWLQDFALRINELSIDVMITP